MTVDRAKKRSSRRKWLIGAGAAFGVGALEFISLQGVFDHRRLPRIVPADKDRYGAALSRLEAEPSLAEGAIVHVGHSTHLLSIAGTRFLTDPWFSDPAFGALKHVVGPAVAPANIGRLDVVLITHDHADHAEVGAIDKLEKKTAIVATDGLAAKMRGVGFKEVHVLPPWSSVRIGEAEITAVPGVHDIYEVGYVIRGAGRTVYFAGDTRLHDDMPAIGERFPKSFAILPVDGTRLTGGALHVMTPDDAVSAVRILGAKGAMPSHAEAEFSDPFVALALASTIDGASAIFGRRMREALPSIPCALPAPGEVVPLPRDG